MRMLMEVIYPLEKFNKAVADGSIGKKTKAILEEIKPEAAYFTERDGKRGTILIVDVAEPSRVPALAEPFFLQFDAKVSFRIVMSPEDLQKAGLEGLGKKWSQ